MTSGDLIVAQVPQSDGQIKDRPVLLLCETPGRYKDWLTCGVSTQLDKEVKSFDEVVAATDPDFAGSGLKKASLIRLGFLAVIPKERISRTIGCISPGRRKRLLQNLADLLLK